MDLAELGLEVNSKPVSSASDALDDFASSAGKAGDAADDYAKKADDAGSATDKMNGELSNAEKGFNLLAVGIGAAVAALGTGFMMGISSSIQRIEEETKLLAQFDQALANTGNTANTTSEQFKKFADELEDATGRAAKDVLEIGSNLATFGFENDVFYDSIKLANDMSAAWGGDLRSSMEGLGRALDSPIDGFAMLAKRGISLTDEQAKLVETLVNTNQKLEAQRYIIEVLNEQVGGVAEAGFTGFAAAQTRLGKAIEGVFDAIVEGTGLIDALSLAMNTAASAINFVSDNLDTLLAILIPVGTALAVSFGPAALAAVTSLTAAIAGPLLSAIGALTMAIMANPLGLLVAGVTAAITIIWKFREELGLTDERLRAIGEVGSRVFNILVTAITKLYEAVAPTLTAIYDRLVSWGTYIVEKLSPAFVAFKEVVVPILEGIWDWVDRILSSLEAMLGILPKAQAAANTNNQQSSATGNMDKKIKDALTSGGDTASKKMKAGVETGGNNAAKSVSSSFEKTGRGLGTALEKANASGAKALSNGVKQGGDSAAAAITAAGQVMAAKFEGTGRNIYDLWNNWGDAFIDGFGTTVGRLLVEFQNAQTRLLKEQAKLVKEQTENMRIQNDYLRKGKSLPGSTGGSSSNSDTTFTGGIVADGWKTWDVGRPLEKYVSGQEEKLPKEISREVFTPVDRTKPVPANSNDRVKVTIINKVDPRDVLNTMTTRKGKETINNLISQSPDVLNAMG